ncbi:MAG: signal peptide peptidase SppA [Deltaproteobacteria bacterium]|nr:signal peptide peptidase SppA [Deltaproteobacteria bacterium]
MRGLIITLIVLVVIFFAFLIGLGAGIAIFREGGFVAGDKVAVMTIDDIILDSKIYLESLSIIKKDDSIKALVLRINSPGGAVGPAQEIYSEAKSLREKIPVIASLGSVAASGGYYIACGAQKIISNPGTITGSIGVIAQFVTYEQLLNWAKVDVEVIKSGKFKDAGSPFREMTEAEKEYMQKVIDNVHSQFKQAVSESRNLSDNEIDKIADGRIFTGQQALELNLVDELGTISDTIRLAGTLGGIKEEPNVIYFPKKKKSIMDFIFSKIDSHGLSTIPLKGRFGLFYLADIVN